MTDWDSSPCLSELPCVPVEIAPATDWTSMLPRLGTERPNLASSVPRSCRLMPASNVTVELSRSTESILLKLSRFIIHDEVQVRSDGE